MSLIAILLSLGLEYFLGSLEDLRRFDWFHRFIDWVRERTAGRPWAEGPPGLLLVFVPAVGAFAVAYALLGELLWILGFAFGVAVLLYSLGPKDLEHDMAGYLDAADRGDSEGALWYAGQVLGRELSEEPQALARRMRDAALVEANDRLFGVLIWFVILGPVGAILFRLASEARRHAYQGEDGFARSADDLYRILAWVPARLVALGYALAGSFVGALGQLRDMDGFWRSDSESLLAATGNGALNHMDGDNAEEPDLEQVQAALTLVRRTLVVGVAVLALLTLAGWAS